MLNFGRVSICWEDNIKVDPREVFTDNVNQFELAGGGILFHRYQISGF